MQRLLVPTLVALAVAGCGGRTGLGVFVDGGGPQHDAGVGDAVEPGDGAEPTDAGRPDGGGRQDAATGKNCAQIMMCAFDSLGSGLNIQALLACTQGATASGLTEGGQLIWCMVQNCAGTLMSDGGGQFDVLMCLIQNCQTEVCACEGIGDIIPPGIIYCP